jgi:hypothetical protein
MQWRFTSRFFALMAFVALAFVSIVAIHYLLGWF